MADQIYTQNHQQNQNPINNGSMDASELVEALLSNDHIPKKIGKQFWVLFGRTAKLTFLTPQDVDEHMKRFELLRMTVIESIPKSSYNEELEFLLDSVAIEFKMNLQRSQGHNDGMNERKTLGFNTQATFAERPISPAFSENAGFFDKLARAFKGGAQQ